MVGVLASAICVMDSFRLWRALEQSHAQRFLNQRLIRRDGHGPYYHAARKEIKHSRKVTCRSLEVGTGKGYNSPADIERLLAALEAIFSNKEATF